MGYIITWQLSTAIFIEHFEIFPSHRGQKIGEKVLEFFRQQYPLVILETEPDYYGEMGQRRINFYKSNGFSIIDKNHLQPAYEKGKDALTLFMMASKIIQNLEEIKKELYNTVYADMV